MAFEKITSREDWEREDPEKKTGVLVVLDASWCEWASRLVQVCLSEVQRRNAVLLRVDLDMLPDVRKEWEVFSAPECRIRTRDGRLVSWDPVQQKTSEQTRKFVQKLFKDCECTKCLEYCEHCSEAHCRLWHSLAWMTGTTSLVEHLNDENIDNVWGLLMPFKHPDDRLQRPEQLPDDLLISVLRVAANVALKSDTFAAQPAEDLATLVAYCCSNNGEMVQTQALLLLGNLCLWPANRKSLLDLSKQIQPIVELAKDMPDDQRPTFFSRNKAARRLLAILGLNNPLPSNRPIQSGIRILTLDGGGMKGLAEIKMLRAIEEGTGRKIHELFDLIAGTSTGSILAFGVGVRRFSLDKCEGMYRDLVRKVVPEASMPLKLYNALRGRGKLHNSELVSKILQETFKDEDGELLIDSAVKGGPKVFAAATLCSTEPSPPFIFRNYQHPPNTPEEPFASGPPTNDTPRNDSCDRYTWPHGSIAADTATPTHAGDQKPELVSKQLAQASKQQFKALPGTCKMYLFQGIQASATTLTYLDPVRAGGLEWVDDSLVANNPTMFAVREAQHLWPDTRIECIVSLGSGKVPPQRRAPSVPLSFQALLQSASSVERAHEAAVIFARSQRGCSYFRFNPEDARCGMGLGDSSDKPLKDLIGATSDYLQRKDVQASLNECCQLLAAEAAP